MIPWGTTVGNVNLTQFANSSLSEGTPFARAIISDMISYYMPSSLGTTLIKNDYYGQVISTFSDSDLTKALVPADLKDLTFPLLAQALTPSASIYHKQQTRFQHIRMRFL